MKHEFRDYLDDIQRSMELALSFTTDMSLADFRDDEKTQYAVSETSLANPHLFPVTLMM